MANRINNKLMRVLKGEIEQTLKLYATDGEDITVIIGPRGGMTPSINVRLAKWTKPFALEMRKEFRKRDGVRVNLIYDKP